LFIQSYQYDRSEFAFVYCIAITPSGEHDLNARSPDFEHSDHNVVQIKDGGRKWLLHLPMKQRLSSTGEEM